MIILKLKDFITEKFNATPIHPNGVSKYKYFPRWENELIEMIAERIENEGVHCDLNDIDVSRIKNMSRLFNQINKTHMFDGGHFTMGCQQCERYVLYVPRVGVQRGHFTMECVKGQKYACYVLPFRFQQGHIGLGCFQRDRYGLYVLRGAVQRQSVKMGRFQCGIYGLYVLPFKIQQRYFTMECVKCQDGQQNVLQFKFQPRHIKVES